jgi:hypothetical protein
VVESDGRIFVIARSRFGIGRLVLGGLATGSVIATLVIAPTAVGQTAPGHGPAGAKGVLQDFTCSTPIGEVIETVGVSAKALPVGARLLLKNVKYAFVNNFGTDITINDVRFAVLGPPRQWAPYQKGSAVVADDPAGWAAGYKAGQLFEHFAGDMDVAADATIPVAALSAAYGSTGPKGTVVKWKAGPFSFFVESGGPIDCSPIAPFRTIASVTE